MKTNSPTVQAEKLDIVGSSTFGRNPKILASRTFNMITSDDWLVDYCGYEFVKNLSNTGNGRALFTSVRNNRLIAVVSNNIYSIAVVNAGSRKIYTSAKIGQLTTFGGDVFMDENNNGEIAICDKHALYIYNYVSGDFREALLPSGVTPGYVTFQNGRFVVPDITGANWYISQFNDGLNWFPGPEGTPLNGGFQTKANAPLVTLRFPGRSNLLFVMGEIVTELWNDNGLPQFPYQKNTSISFDYGCINPGSVAVSEEFVAWLGISEDSGPVLMYSNGSDVKSISTDGINYKLEKLVSPEKCSAFFVKLAGHLIYQITFYGSDDNYSFIYDFTTGKFFDVTDENMNYHIAKQVAFFDNDYYFVSFKDGSLYRMSSELSTFQYEGKDPIEIPRIRVCSNIRMPNSFRFVVNNLTFTLEQGDDTDNQQNVQHYDPRIGLRISSNGGVSFGNFVTYPIYKIGNRPNKLDWWNLGSTNDFVAQIRFWGRGPWRAFDGVANIFQ